MAPVSTPLFRIRFASASATVASLAEVNQAGARSPEGLPEEDTPMDGAIPLWLNLSRLKQLLKVVADDLSTTQDTSALA